METEEQIGAYDGIPFETYHAWDRVTGGFLYTLTEQSPSHAVADMAKEKTTDAMLFGSAFHTALLEPDELEKRYVPKPEGMSFATREGKLWRDTQTKTIINSMAATSAADIWDSLRGMRDAVYADELASSLMNRPGARREVSVAWEEQTSYGISTGLPPVPCKGRPDQFDDEVLIDLKSCVDARPHAFNNRAVDMGYWFKMGWYLDGIEAAGLRRPRDVFLIAVEKKAPWAVNVFVIPTETLNCARMQKEAALFKYRNCLRDGVFPAYGGKVYPITLPAWRIDKIYGRGDQ